ncbi:hypothetical protein Q1695_000666 [Nippostrongylus brasiliensis]|nr:hypothetical protein Q1695_000666 [Nippostrongylus brasiliensis]
MVVSEKQLKQPELVYGSSSDASELRQTTNDAGGGAGSGGYEVVTVLHKSDLVFVTNFYENCHSNTQTVVVVHCQRCYLAIAIVRISM